MSTNFPTNKDDATSLPVEASGTPLSTNHIPSHQNLTDTVIAIEDKVGIDSSADTNSIDYKLKNTGSIDPGHKHTSTSLTLALDDISDVTAPTPADGEFLSWSNANSDWRPTTTSAPDASTTVKGVSKVSVAPVLATNPISVGDNDSRVPTQDENDALAGTSGTPSSTNKFVTNDDADTAATASKIVRRDANTNVAGLANVANIQTFTSSGTYTKSANVKKVFIEVWGGGASGAKASTGGAGSGGGGGEYSTAGRLAPLCFLLLISTTVRTVAPGNTGSPARSTIRSRSETDSSSRRSGAPYLARMNLLDTIMPKRPFGRSRSCSFSMK